ncbi:MAG: S-adenosylmethionine:tRNA ribosyltransferase-isomerase [Candidatus Dormibacteria bacterium]
MPPELEATAPPEQRGRGRDQVRLLVVDPRGVRHHRFSDLPSLLAPGDLVVVNTSATLPAALEARRADGSCSPVHVSSPLDSGDWVVEVRRVDNRGPEPAVAVGEVLQLPGAVTLLLAEAYPVGRVLSSRLWRAVPSPAVPFVAYLTAHGRPIRYPHLRGEIPLSAYQTVYAAQPGSAEMASAGRPFTNPLLARLAALGVTVAGVVLHAGVSSPERHEPPYPERFEVSEATARRVNAARTGGHRIIAVGTTVVRALETVAGADGGVSGGRGWTSLVLGEDRRARVVTGLITGLHLPESSHLRLLEAVAGPELVRGAYKAALERGYLWHEFGDSMLFLP